MIHVITCKKYSSQTIRLVECPADQLEAVLDRDMGECSLCGPMSHVELGKRRNYWDVLSSHKSKEEATEAAWEIVEVSRTTPDVSPWYDTSGLPENISKGETV